MDKKLMSIGAALLGLIIFWAVQNRNDAARALAERGDAPDPKNAAESRRAFEIALEQSTKLLQSGQLIESARKLYHVYPGFESYLQSQGYEEIEQGLTLKDWFESQKSAFVQTISDRYPWMVEQLKSGDLTWREVNTFFNEMPFPFIHEVRRIYEKQKREISQARAAQATTWCYLSVLGVSGSSEEYERMVRAIIQKRWNPQSGLKLLLDNPASGEESRAAAKIIDVRIEEKFAEYSFLNDPSRGVGRVAESTIVQFSARPGPQPRLKTNWESLEPIIVTNQAPEVLNFKLENKWQDVDFTGIANRQRQALEKKLSTALESLPQLELLTPR